MRDARSGGTDSEEAQALAQRAESYIGLARDTYGSGAPANDIMRNVLATTNGLLGNLKADDKAQRTAERTLEVTQRAFEKTLPEALRDSDVITAKGFAETVKELKRLDSRLDDLRLELRSLSRRG